MNKSGCIRKSILIIAIAWAFVHFLLPDSLSIQNPYLRILNTWGPVALAAWGVITLIQQRIAKR